MSNQRPTTNSGVWVKNIVRTRSYTQRLARKRQKYRRVGRTPPSGCNSIEVTALCFIASAASLCLRDTVAGSHRRHQVQAAPASSSSAAAATAALHELFSRYALQTRLIIRCHKTRGVIESGVVRVVCDRSWSDIEYTTACRPLYIARHFVHEA